MNVVRQHLNESGVAEAQFIAPPDFPGDMNPPMNNVATSRYTTTCSHCLTVLPPGTTYVVKFCDGCSEPDEATAGVYVDHTFVVGLCCDPDLAEEIAGGYAAIDEPLAFDHPVFINRAARV
jgi:hypothetical protein